MKVAILGAGALGSLIGARLALHGHDVQLLMRNPVHLEAIRENGLALTMAGVTQTVPIRACLPSDAVEPVDVVVLLTKTYQSDKALQDATHLLRAGTAVLSLQNGLGNADRIAAHVPLPQIYIGISMMPADLTGPGQVSTQGAGHTRFYSADGTDRPFAHEIGAAFNAAQMACEVDTQIQTAIWEKAAFNAASNALLGLTGTTPGALLECPQAMALAQDIATEALAIARASGIAVMASRVTDLLTLSSQKHPNHRPSMAQDIAAKRQTEVDAINGAFVHHASLQGQTAPLNQTIWTIVKLAETGFAPQVTSLKGNSL